MDYVVNGQVRYTSQQVPIYPLHPKVVAAHPGKFVKDVQWIGAGSQPVTQERFEPSSWKVGLSTSPWPRRRLATRPMQGELARSAERLEHPEQARREVSERHAADQAVLSAQLEAQRAARISQEQRARLSCTMVSIPLRPIAAHSRQTFSSPAALASEAC